MGKCMFCESTHRLTVKRIPQHFRQWQDGTGATFVEHMPAADDYECGDCGRMWTVFDADEDTP